MLFNQFKPGENKLAYSNTISEVINILNELDPDKCRLSFCEYNPTTEIGEAVKYDYSNSVLLLNKAHEMGFEAKLFSSYGKEESSACGTLGGKEPMYLASAKWEELEKLSDQLINHYDIYGG